ncbi:MAG: dockerin type I domain-containing protein, partial [Bacteroidota bacterium]
GDTLRQVDVLLPFGVMTASGSAITGSGSFMMTGSGCSLYSAAEVNDGFKLFSAITAFGKGSDMNRQTTSAIGLNCFDITLSMPRSNISIAEDCFTELTPGLLGVHSSLPDSLLEVHIKMPGGGFRPDPFVTEDDVNKIIEVQVQVRDSLCPDVAPVWNNVLIEYKLAPSLICNVDTVDCVDQVAMNLPIITAGCGETQFVRLASQREDICRTSEYLARETTTFAVQDAFGNISDTCTQVRFIRKPNLTRDSIMWPADREFLCTDNIFDQDSALLNQRVGVPTWRGISLAGNELSACNLSAEVEDFLNVRMIRGGQCMQVRTRRWTVYEWRCNEGLVEIPGPIQQIVLIDSIPPVISGSPDVVTPIPDSLLFSVDPFECVATFQAPRLFAIDDCNQDMTTIEFRYLDTILTNDFDAEIKLPVGENRIEYIARDGCGNVSRDTVFVRVIDNTAPVAICIKEMVVSITDTEVLINADNIDQDSYDACGITDVLIRRMTSPCNPMDTLFGPTVTFCCEDGNTDVPVILRVTDMNGNFNECMVMVQVTDKSPARVTGLPDIDMTCEFPIDPMNLDIFGTIEMNPTNDPDSILLPQEFFLSASGPLLNGRISDNCGAMIEELDPIVNLDSICRTGSILRRFTVTDASGITTAIRQRIRLVNDALNNPVFFTFVPNDTTIMPAMGDEVANLAKDHPATAGGDGCARPYIGFRDRVFTTDSSVFCTKIERTWEIIDWCKERSTDEIIEADSVQYIFVIDSVAPEVVINTNATPRSQPALINISISDNVVLTSSQLDVSYRVISVGTNTAVISADAKSDEFSNDDLTLLIDGLPGGDYDFEITVLDPCGNMTTRTQRITLRPVGARSVAIVGQVLYSGDLSMDNVEVFLSTEAQIDAQSEMDMTDTDGYYDFGDMPEGGSYFVTPLKDDDLLNGVSTMDMLIIQRHILGIADLQTPEQYIAADVNNDGRISAFDILELRKAILGKTLRFPNNDSWTFAYDDQDLQGVIQSGDAIMKQYAITQLTEDMDITFQGIKIGDVNATAIGHSAGVSGGRTSRVASLKYEIDKVGGQYITSIVAGENMNINGLQAAWDLPTEEIRLASGALDLSSDRYHIDASGLMLSIIEPQGLSVTKGEVLFSIRSEQPIQPDQLLANRISPEVYFGEVVARIELTPVVATSELLTVSQNSPNPWSESTVITAQVPTDGQIELRVYDVHHRVIYSESRVVTEGTQTFTIDQEKIADSGIYFYEIEAGDQRVYQKMLRVN